MWESIKMHFYYFLVHKVMPDELKLHVLAGVHTEIYQYTNLNPDHDSFLRVASTWCDRHGFSK